MELTCDRCGRAFTAKRSDARFCSGRCRTDAYRDRNAPDRPKRRRRPLTDDMRAAGLDLDRSVARWSRIVNDDRMPRVRKTMGAGHRNRIMSLIRELEEVADQLNVTDD